MNHARPYATVRRQSRIRWWLGFAAEFVVFFAALVGIVMAASLAGPPPR